MESFPLITRTAQKQNGGGSKTKKGDTKSSSKNYGRGNTQTGDLIILK
jgi:hypothetical protein